MVKVKAHTFIAYAAGAVCSIAWWLWIDATVTNAVTDQAIPVTPWHYGPIVFASLAVIVMNLPNSASLESDDFDGSSRGRYVIFGGFMLGMCAIVAAIWIAVQNWFIAERSSSAYAPVILCISNTMIFIGGLMLRFSKGTSDDSF